MNPTPTPVDLFWVDVGGQVIAGVVVFLISTVFALIASVLVKSWREHVWGWLGRLIDRVKGIGLRISTAKQRQVEVDRAASDAVEKFKASLTPPVLDMAERIQGLQAGLDRAKEAGAADAKKALGRGIELGRQQIVEEISARKTFRPTPRWSVTRQASGSFVLRNSTKNSIARAVRLDADKKLFGFRSSGQWENFDGERAAVFDGTATAAGSYNGIEFEVSFVDEDGNRVVDEVFIDGWDVGVF